MDHMKDLLHWASVWDKALEKNLFPKAEQNIVPSAQNGTESFFGLKSRSDYAPESPSAPDAEYWNKVYQKSKHTGPGAAPEIFSESVASNVKIVKDNPNPIKLSTVGADQAPTPEAIDTTFSEKDIEDLAELKTKLHELNSKLSEFEGRGENGKKFESQIAKIKTQIDELSDSMTRSFSVKD